MIVIFLVEMVNLAILLTNVSILDIIMNFLALVIIGEFDDFFFFTLRKEPFSDLVKDGEVVIDENAPTVKLDEIL